MWPSGNMDKFEHVFKSFGKEKIMRNYDDCVFDMICPSCGIDLNQHSNNQISRVDEIGYNIESPVIGKGQHGDVDVDNRNPCILDEQILNTYYQCDHCGTELPFDFVYALVTRWEELDTESRQEIDEESKINQEGSNGK